MMEYITAKLYPGAFSDTEAAVLRTISAAGVWNPRTSDLNGNQLRALLTLRHAGYIEHAAHGGYKVRGNQYTVARADAIDVTAIERISVCKPLYRVMVVMRDGRAHQFVFTAEGWQYAAGLLELAKSFGAPEVNRLQSTLEVYRNKNVA